MLCRLFSFLHCFSPHVYLSGYFFRKQVLRLAFYAKAWNHSGQEIALATRDKIDWSECPLVEIKQGVQSGAPVLRGTRMPANAIVDNFDYGMSVSEIAEQFELPPDRIEAILAYAQSHRVAHPV
jgi:uncharacterized protein (DUF433 family)